jgi:uncharacterized membrane protein
MICKICGSELKSEEEDEEICWNCQCSMISSGMV